MAQRRRRNRKKITFAVFLVLIIIAGIVGYFVWDGYFRDKKKDDVEENASSEVINIVPDEDKDGKGSAGDVVIEEKEPVVQYDGEDPNESNELTGVITYADVVGDKLMIRVNIDQYLEGGSCELNLIQGDLKYSDFANINSVTTATCEGFDVPVGKLDGGNYQILIKLNAEGKIGVISGEINI